MSSLGDLSQDLIGTDPKYPKIVNQSWLSEAKEGYDNYPSDNNPVRIQPKLSEMWNHEPQAPSIAIIPNATVQPLGVRSDDKQKRETVAGVSSVIREAKKAVMAGLRGAGLAKHLRARFATKHIEAAEEALKKVADEIGLLGNVYIDASAFASYEEAKRFMEQHRNRLAQDVLFDVEQPNLTRHVASMLASDFRKNVVTKISYDERLFDKYKKHLVRAKDLPEDFVIDSRETLKQAFLYEKPEPKAPKAKEEKKLSVEEISEGLNKLASKHSVEARENDDAIRFERVRPVIAFIQENLSRGKSKKALKELIRSKFDLDTIRIASDCIAIAVSEDGLSTKHVDDLATNGNISKVIAKELKKIAKEFPVKEAREFDAGNKPERQVGQRGYLYALSGKSANTDKALTSAVTALRSGVQPSAVKAKLNEVMPEKANEIMAAALTEYNAMPAGVQANKAVKPKKALVESPKPKKVLPDESSIMPQLQEFNDFYKGAREMVVEVDAVRGSNNVQVDDLFNRDGIDQQFAE